ncbi:MAG: molybdopterin molybdotransferase MoeA [Saprospiraceae bacterium]|nr:molybdopterin molybdotransferase MoeA [Saprospiraceae bacterium]
MLTTQEASEIILAHAGHFGEEAVALESALGRVLREPLLADRDFPPFPRVTMDGIAIAFQAFTEGQSAFFIEEIQAAGAPQLQLSNPANALEVMTGAILPLGADTVIRYEDLNIVDGIAQVQIEDIRAGQNVHPRGSDRRAGQEITAAGRLIGAAEIGVAATVGKNALRVARLPRVLIVYTGDELVEVDAVPLPHQIRVSNAYTIQALLSPWGIRAGRLHIADDLARTKDALRDALQQYDVLLLSGGVSEGKYDYVPRALSELGVRQLFHKVAQRPGKPFWFGCVPEGAAVFALPGNPVSAFVGARRYFVPWLRQSLGLPPEAEEWAVLTEPFDFKPDLTYFLQVRLHSGPTGVRSAQPIAGKGSGDLANLADADAFLELPKGRDHFPAGEAFRVWRYR